VVMMNTTRMVVLDAADHLVETEEVQLDR